MMAPPSLEVKAESSAKAVEKVKGKLSYAYSKEASLRGANLSGADFKGADLSEAKGLPGTRLTHTQQSLEKRKEN